MIRIPYKKLDSTVKSSVRKVGEQSIRPSPNLKIYSPVLPNITNHTR